MIAVTTTTQIYGVWISSALFKPKHKMWKEKKNHVKVVEGIYMVVRQNGTF